MQHKDEQRVLQLFSFILTSLASGPGGVLAVFPPVPVLGCFHHTQALPLRHPLEPPGKTGYSLLLTGTPLFLSLSAWSCSLLG